MGKHSVSGRRPRTVKMVDTYGTEHLLTPEALAAGRGGGGRYYPLCQSEVIPAALVDPPMTYCRLCIRLPAQRSVGV